ncbi:hypothetical protein B0H14DRAFT_2585294 [Mycena olivaceomarginata]|nr:hypothetical protein B0H14DRAFT_2585294 [Mycena olivaceomarginata]
MTAMEETVKHNGVIIPLRFEAGPLYLEIAIYVTGNRSVRRRSFRDDWQWRQWFVEMTRKWLMIVTGTIMKWEGIAERYNCFPVDSADFGFFNLRGWNNSESHHWAPTLKVGDNVHHDENAPPPESAVYMSRNWFPNPEAVRAA